MPASDTSASSTGFAAGSAWREMITAFRAHGGKAVNVTSVQGPSSAGLFAVDRTKQLQIRVPKTLFYSVDDLEFVDGGPKIKKEAAVAPAHRAFFDEYQKAFSWGAGPHSKFAELIRALEALPADVRNILVVDFGFGDLLQGDFSERMRNRFLTYSFAERNGRKILVPVIELANYGSAGLTCGIDAAGHMHVTGVAPNEILIQHPAYDAFHVFRTYGAAGTTNEAFSLPLSIDLGGTFLVVQQNFSARQKRERWVAPRVSVEENKVSFSFLAVGNRKLPRVPRGAFRQLAREANLEGADEIFDLLLFANRTKFVRLLQALNPHKGTTVSILGAMARAQLETMAYCIGAREL